MKIGYMLASEQFTPAELVDQARRARDAGFDVLSISDHFHPWNDAQGHSPIVWPVIGALSEAVPGLRVSTMVTCPTLRIHPVVMAHAAATAAVMLEGRFVFRVGSGENLNEHVTGRPWPPARDRLERLREAVELIRRLWDGGNVNFDGRHYRAVNARLYTVPAEPPPSTSRGSVQPRSDSQRRSATVSSRWIPSSSGPTVRRADAARPRRRSRRATAKTNGQPSRSRTGPGRRRHFRGSSTRSSPPRRCSSRRAPSSPRSRSQARCRAGRTRGNTSTPWSRFCPRGSTRSTCSTSARHGRLLRALRDGRPAGGAPVGSSVKCTVRRPSAGVHRRGKNMRGATEQERQFTERHPGGDHDGPASQT